MDDAAVQGILAADALLAWGKVPKRWHHTNKQHDSAMRAAWDEAFSFGIEAVATVFEGAALFPDGAFFSRFLDAEDVHRLTMTIAMCQKVRAARPAWACYEHRAQQASDDAGDPKRRRRAEGAARFPIDLSAAVLAYVRKEDLVASQAWLVCGAFAAAVPVAHDWTELLVARDICDASPQSLAGGRCLSAREAKLLPCSIRDRVSTLGLVHGLVEYGGHTDILMQLPEFRHVRLAVFVTAPGVHADRTAAMYGHRVELLGLARYACTLRVEDDSFNVSISKNITLRGAAAWPNLRSVLATSSQEMWFRATPFECIETDVPFAALAPNIEAPGTSVFDHRAHLRVLTSLDYDTCRLFLALPQTPNSFPQLEVFGYIESRMEREALSELFRHCAVMMPCLSHLLIDTDSSTFDAATWRVFRELPPTITDVFLGIDACDFGDAAVDESNVLSRIQQHLREHVTCHVHQTTEFDTISGGRASCIVQSMRHRRRGQGGGGTARFYRSGKGVLGTEE